MHAVPERGGGQSPLRPPACCWTRVPSGPIVRRQLQALQAEGQRQAGDGDTDAGELRLTHPEFCGTKRMEKDRKMLDLQVAGYRGRQVVSMGGRGVGRVSE